MYPSVLFVQALVDLVSLKEQGHLDGVFEDELDSRLSIALFQACLRTLLDQEKDGSWNGSIEESAYGLLILSEARRVCFFEDLQTPLEDAIRRAVAFLESQDVDKPNYVWIEKVSYASPLLTQSYVLAALKASSLPPASPVGSKFWQMAKPRVGMNKHVDLFYQAPLFSSLPKWELHASMVEAALFLPSLRSRRTDVFPRKDLESDDKYFDVIVRMKPQKPGDSCKYILT